MANSRYFKNLISRSKINAETSILLKLIKHLTTFPFGCSRAVIFENQ